VTASRISDVVVKAKSPLTHSLTHQMSPHSTQLNSTPHQTSLSKFRIHFVSVVLTSQIFTDLCTAIHVCNLLFHERPVKPSFRYTASVLPAEGSITYRNAVKPSKIW